MSVPTISHHQRAALLTAADERALARQIEAGREAAGRITSGTAQPRDHELAARGHRAKNRFVEANIRLVISTARSFRTPTHVDRNDVIQDGILGLERAVDRFDWRKGYKFSTYATWWIRQSMQRGLENTGTTIRIPAHRNSELRVALATGLSGPDDLPERLRTIAALSSIDSIDRSTGNQDGDQQRVGDLLASNDDGPDLLTEQSLDRDTVHRLLDRLDPATRWIIELRFGFGNEPPQTYASIAGRLDMSHESVRRRVLRALATLRPAAEALAA
jgi:RNA polymerase sigma factor (sigma-70 family)